VTPLRALSIGCALFAARRWPALAAVGGLLAVEVLAGEVAAALPSAPLSALAWGSSSALLVGVGATLGRASSARALSLTAVQLLASLALLHWPRLHALTIAVGCAYALALVLVSATPRDVGRASVASLLAGNLAAFVLLAALGVERAYNADLVLWSNNITHASISGLALWTMRAR
jgi:hypothetical protein